MQGQYQTVAEALRAAVLSLLEDEEMIYKDSFYYWAAFISHGFASVKLDDALLDQIHHKTREYLAKLDTPIIGPGTRIARTE